MTKVIIPARDEKIIVQRNKLEIDVEVGDLVLLTNVMHLDSQGNRKYAYLGVFQELVNRGRNEKIDLGNYFTLRRCEKFGGIDLPILETKCGLITVSSYLRDFYSGQEQIVQALQGWPGFEAHAEWVTRLRKPYLE